MPLSMTISGSRFLPSVNRFAVQRERSTLAVGLGGCAGQRVPTVAVEEVEKLFPGCSALSLQGNFLCLDNEADSYFEVPGYGSCVASKALGEGRTTLFGQIFMHYGGPFAMAPLYAAHVQAAYHTMREPTGVISEVACKNLFPVKQFFEITGLQSSPELNGATGWVVAHRQDALGNWRIALVLPNREKPVLCKHVNLFFPKVS